MQRLFILEIQQHLVLQKLFLLILDFTQFLFTELLMNFIKLVLHY
ncbi:UNVERIFIED_CONTAM: hypothetical protein GTU68_049884 [Idotea baltica]|nr:hypothetical protein [Idotea baltica]